MKFTLDEYDLLLGKLEKKDYQCISYFGEVKRKRQILLRHDIDVDIFNCLKIAAIEEKHGFFSTWFIQIDNSFYNPLSVRARGILAQLAKKHMLGIHINPEFYEQGKTKEFEIFLDKTYEYYSEFIDLKRVFSFHRPAKYCNIREVEISNYINAYNPCYTKIMDYISDSNRRPFLEDEKIERAIENVHSINLLTHPLWWSASEMDLYEKYADIKEKAEQFLCREVLQNNITCYKYLEEEKEQ